MLRAPIPAGFIAVAALVLAALPSRSIPAWVSVFAVGVYMLWVGVNRFFFKERLGANSWLLAGCAALCHGVVLAVLASGATTNFRAWHSQAPEWRTGAGIILAAISLLGIWLWQDAFALRRHGRSS